SSGCRAPRRADLPTGLPRRARSPDDLRSGAIRRAEPALRGDRGAEERPPPPRKRDPERALRRPGRAAEPQPAGGLRDGTGSVRPRLTRIGVVVLDGELAV